MIPTIPIDRLMNSIKSWPQQLQPAQVTRILRSAFDVWSGVSKLDFQQVPASQEAEIEIEFLRGNHGDSFPFDGPGRTHLETGICSLVSAGISIDGLTYAT